MKILIFLHGTALMHKNAVGKTRNERVEQSIKREKSVLDYENYVPINKAVEKLKKWESQGAEISYLSSHESEGDVEKDKLVLKKYSFPKGAIYWRQNNKTYAQVTERIIPDVLIEDDCESIGGKSEMTITNIKPEIKKKIKSIVVKEFGGIDHLPDKISELLNYNSPWIKYR